VTGDRVGEAGAYPNASVVIGRWSRLPDRLPAHAGTGAAFADEEVRGAPENRRSRTRNFWKELGRLHLLNEAATFSAPTGTLR
jgi:hypothetical protein